MRRTLLVLATLSAALLAPAPPAAAVAYSTVVVAPGDLVRGTVPSGHTSPDASGTRSSPRTASTARGWVSMERVGERSFSLSTNPWAPEGLLNGDYQLEVRVWATCRRTTRPTPPHILELNADEVVTLGGRRMRFRRHTDS